MQSLLSQNPHKNTYFLSRGEYMPELRSDWKHAIDEDTELVGKQPEGVSFLKILKSPCFG